MLVRATLLGSTSCASSPRVSTLAAAALQQRREFGGRAVPWVPQGTMMDFSGSLRHQELHDIQADLDRAAGRPVEPRSSTQDGPVVMGADGKFRPYDPAAKLRQDKQGSSFSTQEAQRRSIRDAHEDEVLMNPHDELSQERFIRERLFAPQRDGHGPQARPPVAPPPPIDPDAPKGYIPEKVHLDRTWYKMMGGIVVTLYLMMTFGK